ncbi:MAG TPA: kelch repeat-containing protein [Acidimicrobiales bacterium]|nr:kelch repeat-containing protein [Acidimicrobiales bacterium]
MRQGRRLNGGVRHVAVVVAALLVLAGVHVVAGPGLARAAGSWSVTTTLSTSRSAHTATVLSGPACAAASPPTCGKILIAGGGTATAELYDPMTRTTSPTGSMSAVRSRHTGTLLGDGRVLVVAGVDGNLDPLATAELYDPRFGQWTQAPSLSTARHAHTTTLLKDGRVLVAGGFSGPGQCYEREETCPQLLTSSELYTPASGNNASGGGWTTGPDMRYEQAQHTATLLDGPACRSSSPPVYCGQALLVGGTVRRGTSVDRAQLYHPGPAGSTGAWVPTDPPIHNRRAHTATLLEDGRVLAAGGDNCGTSPVGRTIATLQGSFSSPCGTTASAELYQPETGTWTPAASFTTDKRREHTATLLPGSGGKVLVAAGKTDGDSAEGEPLATAELFDPEAPGTDDTGAPVRGGWERTDALVLARAGHTATALPSGKVLVAGGDATGAAVEIFDASLQVRPPSVVRLEPPTGPTSGGNAVVITGAGFNEVTGVKFGDGDASYFRQESSTRIVATAPAGSGAVHVTVTTPAGTSSPHSGSRFTYHEPNGTWAATGAMSAPRAGHTATPLNDAAGTVLIVGGASKTAELYAPASGRFQKARGEMKVARSDHTATLLSDGNVLVAGGGTKMAELYDPLTQTWSDAGEMKASRNGHTATILPSGNALFVGGGEATAELYDPSKRRFELALRRPNASRQFHTATVLSDNKVLLVGGPDRTAELYDPSDGSFTAVGAMAGARWRHTAIALPGGRVLVVGGEVPNGPTAEIYESGRWAKSDWQPGSARSRHTATPLDDGTILLAGGCSIASSEIYDPNTADPVPTVDMLVPRSHHTATKLGDGRVLVTGGIGEAGRQVASAEVFDPMSSRAEPSVVALSPSGGTTSGGTEVRITGSGFFQPETTVRFGELPATRLTVASDREIIAVAPAHPQGVVDVTVSTSPLQTTRGVPYLYAPGAWSPTASLNDCRPASGDCAGRSLHTATTLGDGRVLLTGGLNQGAALKSDQVFDPSTSTWAPAGSMANPRWGHAAAALAGGGVLVAGVPASSPTGAVENLGRDVAETFDPNLIDPATGRSGVWSTTGRVVERRIGPTATLLADGNVLVAGGGSPSGGQLATAELYNPTTRTWQATKGTMAQQQRAPHTATRLENGKVLLVGGAGPQAARTELYDPSTQTFSDAGNLKTPRILHTATRLDGPACRTLPRPAFCGKVMVAGGFRGGLSLMSAELYDPTEPDLAKRWTTAGQLLEVRRDHTAALLPDGTVLVVGGHVADGRLASSAEIFDPRTGEWNKTSPMATSRVRHTAIALQEGNCGLCGSVLVTGGDQTNPNLTVPSAEVYSLAPKVTSISVNEGPSAGGTSVVITGTALNGATGVNFGEVPATSFTVDSATQITAVTPPHQAGTVEVVVTTPGGSSLANPPRPNEFTFISSGVPGKITDLAAKVHSEAAVELSWTTAGSDGIFGPPATRYVVKESTSPITNEDEFNAATAVCEGGCSFPAASLGRAITLSIHGLIPGTGYHYAVRAVGPNGVEGPLSNTVSVTTAGTPPVLDANCPALPVPGAGQLAYRSGYSMVGLPAGTRVDAQSPLYSWFDLGARGSYSTQPGNEAVAEGRGYWAWFSCPRLVSLAGEGTDAVDLPLGGYRASMVGNPSGTTAASLSGHDFAARWDPNLNGGAGGYHISGYREEQTLPVGGATWVFSYRSTTISVGR